MKRIKWHDEHGIPAIVGFTFVAPPAFVAPPEVVRDLPELAPFEGTVDNTGTGELSDPEDADAIDEAIVDDLTDGGDPMLYADKPA